MTLTVRLPQKLEDALSEYSSSNGLSKSHVVQEALAQYLVQTQRSEARQPSETYKALKKAGLIGCFSGDGVSATKEVVRQKVLESRKRKRERNLG
jgi:predicted transcriptional regulator